MTTNPFDDVQAASAVLIAAQEEFNTLVQTFKAKAEGEETRLEVMTLYTTTVALSKAHVEFQKKLTDVRAALPPQGRVQIASAVKAFKKVHGKKSEECTDLLTALRDKYTYLPKI